MANASTVRQWARDNGRGSLRGKLPDAVVEDWNTAHPDDPYQVHHLNGSISQEEMDAYFTDDDPPASDDGFDAGEVRPAKPAARAPRKPAPGKPQGKRQGLLGGLTGGTRKKTPRVSTEDLWGALWRGGAKFAAPLPPLYRVLRVESVVAGPLMEDAVKGTVIDTVAQPFARLTGVSKTVQALIGPPLAITAMAQHAAQMQAQGREPNALFMNLGEELLRSSLIALLDIGGTKFEQAVQREREQEERLGMSVDAFMAYLWSPPATTPEQQQQEEAIFRHIIHADEPATM